MDLMEEDRFGPRPGRSQEQWDAGRRHCDRDWDAGYVTPPGTLWAMAPHYRGGYAQRHNERVTEWAATR
jgi:hypothetical protein